MPQSASPPALDRKLRALIARRREEREAEEHRPARERVADRVTAFTGSLRFVSLHLALFGGWIVLNLGWLPVRPFDPDFVKLAMVASVEAIFPSTFVLITRNRMAAVAERRAQLDLQISLLAEHETTRVISLTQAIARRMGVQEAQDPELSPLEQDVAPEMVLARMDEYGATAPPGGSPPARPRTDPAR